MTWRYQAFNSGRTRQNDLLYQSVEIRLEIAALIVCYEIYRNALVGKSRRFGFCASVCP